MRVFDESLIAMILVLAAPATLPAQRPVGTVQPGSMFGPRTLGQPLRPGASQLDIALKRGPSGDFLGTGRYNGPSMFATPWRPAVEPAQFYYEPVVPWQPASASAAAAEAAVAAPATQPAPMYGQPAPGTQYSPSGVQGEESGAAATPALPAAAVGGPRYRMPASTPVFAGGSARAATQGDAPAPEVSARLTRIARSHGIRTPTGISVSIAGGTAVLRGVVGTQRDRTVLGNMAMLEPGVVQVDNQLMIAAEPLASGEPKR